MPVDENRNISLKEMMQNSSESNALSISSEFQVVILIFLEVLIVAGNLLTMLTVWRLRKHPLVVDVLLFSLSLVDVLNALTSVTIAILMRFLILRGQEIPRMLCRAQGWCIVSFEMMSVFIISLVCFDRFTAIVKPFWHRVHLTCSQMLKAVVIVVTFSSIVASLPLLGWEAYRPVEWLAICLFDYRSSYAIFIAFFGYSQLCFVLFSAIAIVYSLRKISKKRRRLTARYFTNRHIVRNTELMPTQRVRTNSERQSRQLAKICMVVVLFFYMSWLPLVMCITMQQVSVMDFTKMVFVASLLALSSPVANPCIYFLMWKRYRKALIQMFGDIKWRNHSLRGKAFPHVPQENSRPRKDGRPSSLTMLPLSSRADDGRGSSSSFIFTDLHERCQAPDAEVDLTHRKPSYRRRGMMKCTLKEEWKLHKLESCEKNYVMHQLMATNHADLKYRRLETYV